MNSKGTLQWQASVESAQQEQNGAPRKGNRSTKATAPGHPLSGTLEMNKKSVLLVDSNRHSRESRAKVMRTMGVRVVCADNACSARVRLVKEKYNLILVDLGPDVTAAESLVSEIRTKNSRQLVGFLVGSPLFVAQSLEGRPGISSSAEHGSIGNDELEQTKLAS